MTMRAATTMFGLAMLSATAGAAELAGSEWRPTGIGAALWPDDAGAFVRFEGAGRLAENSGCNRFMGSYALAGDGIEIGTLAATRMTCPAPLMEHERLLFDALERAHTFSRNGTELMLADPEGHPAHFVQTDWD
jgi:heat shock protein HslJ